MTDAKFDYTFVLGFHAMTKDAIYIALDIILLYIPTKKFQDYGIEVVEKVEGKIFSKKALCVKN